MKDAVICFQAKNVFEIAILLERLIKEAHKNGVGAIKSKRFQFAIARVN